MFEGDLSIQMENTKFITEYFTVYNFTSMQIHKVVKYISSKIRLSWLLVAALK